MDTQLGIEDELKDLTLHQYKTIKAIWQSNNQGLEFEEYLKRVCQLKGYKYDTALHYADKTGIDNYREQYAKENKIPLKDKIKQKEAGLAPEKQVHHHKYYKTTEALHFDKKLVKLCCDCGYSQAIDIIYA